MTLEQAIEIRQRQLSGVRVAADELDEAVALIRSVAPTRVGMREGSMPRKVMELLADKAMPRLEFYETARQMSELAHTSISRLIHRGYIKCEVSLTAEGLRALRAKRPTT